MNIRFPVAADFAFFAPFYSLRKFSFLKLLFFTSFFLYTIVHGFGLNRCEVEEGLNRVDRMSAAIISFVRYFHNFLCNVYPCVFVPFERNCFRHYSWRGFSTRSFLLHQHRSAHVSSTQRRESSMRELCNLRNVRK